MTPKIVTQNEEPVTQSAPEENVTETNCVHHWIIEPPTQRISKGVCKLCGATKEFENWAFEAE